MSYEQAETIVSLHKQDKNEARSFKKGQRRNRKFIPVVKSIIAVHKFAVSFSHYFLLARTM